MSLKLMVPTVPANPKAYLQAYEVAAKKALATGASQGGFPVQVDAWIQRIDQFTAITEKNHLTACSASAQEHAAVLYKNGPAFAFTHQSMIIGATAALEHQRGIVSTSPSSAETDRLGRLQTAISKANTRHFAFVNQQRVEPWASIH